MKAFDRGRYEDALRLWLPLATQGRAQAQFNLALLYENGLGVAASPAEAARWYLAAAERGDAEAQAKVASLYEAGIGVARDPERAAYWHSQRARSSVSPESVTMFDGGRYLLSRADNGECVIALQGAVTHSADDKFDVVVGKAKAQGCARPLTLLLESPGGLVDAGISIGRSVRAEGMRTVARYACASSCANIFLGGTERVLWGSRAAIGLHQPSRVRDGSCVTTNFDPPVIAMRRYVQFALPETYDQVMQLSMDTPCKSITWVRGSRAIELKLATRVEAERQDVFGPHSARLAASDAAPR